MGNDASYSSGRAGMTAACRPPRGLDERVSFIKTDMDKAQFYLPSFYESLPHIISESISVR